MTGPEILRPETDEEARAIVADALASRTPLEILGNGTKRRIGHAIAAAHAVSTSGIAGVSLYEPEELVMIAGPGTPMEQIRLQLDQHGQMLAFEPPDYGPLLGAPAEKSTIGGVLAGNLSGPRRVRAGAARDHFLGVRAVSGRGEVFRSGGRVVKNVTGYDLCKLLCGSWGTLAVMTEVTVKVMPAPERTRTVLIAGLEIQVAVRAMIDALNSEHDVSAAAWLPGPIAAASQVSYVAGSGESVVALRLEGIEVSVDARCAALREGMARYGAIEELHTQNSKRFWREVRDVAPFRNTAADEAVWRISVPPAGAAAIVRAIAETLEARCFADWGGGLLWVAVSGEADAGASMVRGIIAGSGGHATLIRASDEQRAVSHVFQPEAEPLATLTRRIKEGFDPAAILNPGRMFREL